MTEMSLEETEDLIAETDKLIETNTICQAYARVEHLERVKSALRQLLQAQTWKPIWTPEQVSNLHAWQHADHVHPFTCPHRSDHPAVNGDKGILIPTVCGWICQFCDYTQDWAHSSMLSPLPLPPLKEQGE